MNILFDSDGLFALYVATDVHHERAKEMFASLLLGKKNQFYVSNLVLQETATVLSYRFGQEVALDFMTRVQRLPIVRIFVEEKMEAQAWNVFGKQNKKGTSFIDCSNLAIQEQHGIDTIFSFDKFYKDKKI